MAVHFLLLLFLPSLASTAAGGPIENSVLRLIASDSFLDLKEDRRCRYQDHYQIYLVDNFDEQVQLVPEVTTTHGELLKRLLLSGRNDIHILELNTSLGRGMAQIIDRLVQGDCADAVISSTPGSNYTYQQVSSLLIDPVELGPDNILNYKRILAQFIKDIAFHGFPSTHWLEGIDINPVKLANDARKLAFIGALDQFSVPVILPYGNADTLHNGQPKDINLLSLHNNVKAFSALDQHGNKVLSFPYSPLSAGSEQAFYTLFECPDDQNRFIAHLDINNDGVADYSYQNRGPLAYRNSRGRLTLTPPVMQPKEFAALVQNNANQADCSVNESIVVTTEQFRKLKLQCSLDCAAKPLRSHVWLNFSERDCLTFDAQCLPRGQLSGTSLIPPLKIKELLPPKGIHSASLPGHR